METDRELLEWAAKAAGIYRATHPCLGKDFMVVVEPCGTSWNPLVSDADALMLAVLLCFEIKIGDYGTSVRSTGGSWHGCEAHMHGGIESATRRAITRAAAEIGKQKGKQE